MTSKVSCLMVPTDLKRFVCQLGQAHQQCGVQQQPTQQHGVSRHPRSSESFAFRTHISQQTGSQSQQPLRQKDEGDGLHAQVHVAHVYRHPVHFMGNCALQSQQHPRPLRSILATTFPSLSWKPTCNTGFFWTSSKQVQHLFKHRIVRDTCPIACPSANAMIRGTLQHNLA